MTDTYTLPGDPPVALTLRRSARARRVSLRVSRLDGAVTLTVPQRLPLRQALDFVAERRDWIDSARALAPERQPVQAGAVVPVLGQPCRIVPTPGIRAPRLADGVLQVAPGKPVGASVRAYLRTLARDSLARQAGAHARTLGVGLGSITLRDTRSRWGSCTARGDLMFSWRIAMAPPEVLDYLAAHEVAHRVEMNHSDRFWAVCQRLCPQMKRHRAWLKTEGPALHRYDFDAS